MPGFGRVRLAPALGELSRLTATHPHPAGPIRVTYVRNGDAMTAEIVLPPGVDGSFVWQGREHPVRSGAQTLALRADGSLR
jgi:alpha-L-rhamnosidase